MALETVGAVEQAAPTLVSVGGHGARCWVCGDDRLDESGWCDECGGVCVLEEVEHG